MDKTTTLQSVNAQNLSVYLDKIIISLLNVFLLRFFYVNFRFRMSRLPIYSLSSWVNWYRIVFDDQQVNPVLLVTAFWTNATRDSLCASQTQTNSTQNNNNHNKYSLELNHKCKMTKKKKYIYMQINANVNRFFQQLVQLSSHVFTLYLPKVSLFRSFDKKNNSANQTLQMKNESQLCCCDLRLHRREVLLGCNCDINSLSNYCRIIVHCPVKRSHCLWMRNACAAWTKEEEEEAAKKASLVVR